MHAVVGLHPSRFCIIALCRCGKVGFRITSGLLHFRSVEETEKRHVRFARTLNWCFGCVVSQRTHTLIVTPREYVMCLQDSFMLSIIPGFVQTSPYGRQGLVAV